MSDTTFIIVKCSLLTANIVGCFGNLSILWATCRNKQLQHRCGVLVALLSFFNQMCLWYEIPSLIRMTFGLTESTLRNCFWWNVGYIIVEIQMSISRPMFPAFQRGTKSMAQCHKMNGKSVDVTYMMSAIGFDRAISIFLPITYVLWNTRIYLMCIITPGFVLGFYLMIRTLFSLSDDYVEVCVLPFAMPGHISNHWNKINVTCDFCTLVFYCLAWFKLYFFSPFSDNSSQNKTQKIILNSLMVHMGTYLVTGFASSAGIFFMRNVFHASDEILVDAETLAVIPGLLTYSIGYYVYFWRSMDYRNAFLSQFPFNRKKQHAVNSSSIITRKEEQLKATGHTVNTT